MREAIQSLSDNRPAAALSLSRAPARASLIALIGRLGAPGSWRGQPGEGHEPLAHTFELDVVHPNETHEIDDARLPSLATRAQNRVLRLRAEARAAYASVVGAHDAALDAALAVVEAEWQATARERDRYGEALKAIRLYSGDADSRQRARFALESRNDGHGRPGGKPDASGACGVPTMKDRAGHSLL